MLLLVECANFDEVEILDREEEYSHEIKWCREAEWCREPWAVEILWKEIEMERVIFLEIDKTMQDLLQEKTILQPVSLCKMYHKNKYFIFSLSFSHDVYYDQDSNTRTFSFKIFFYLNRMMNTFGMANAI